MKFLLFFLFSLILPFLSMAQEDKINMRFEEVKVSVNPGETFKNILVISNQSNQTITLKRHIKGEDIALLKIPSEIVLSANEVLKFPVKYIANDALIRSGNKIDYQFTVLSGAIENQQNVSFLLDIADDKSIWIVKGQELIYLNPGKQEQEFSVVLENASYGARQLELEIYATPSGLEFPGLDPALELKGKERKWVKFKIVQRKDKGYSPDYQIEIRLKDRLTGKLITTSRLAASALTNTQQLFSSQLAYIQSNFAELTYNQTGSNYQYTQLRGAADFPLGNARAKFSSTLEYYNQQQGLNIYDTWLEVKSGKFDMRVGNLSGENIDFNLSGRGAKVSYAINDHARVEVVGAENNFQLYSNIYQPYQTGKAIAASYLLNNKVFDKGRFSLLYSKDPAKGIDTKMASFETTFLLDSTDNLRIQGGLSHEIWQNAGSPENGFAMGAVYNTDFLGWRIYSDNYYSTPNYAGNRRGNFYLNQRFSRSINEKSSFFLSYINSINNPKYFDNQFDLPFQFNSYPGDGINQSNYLNSTLSWRNFSSHEQSLGLGFSSRTSKLSYSIEPRVEDQRRVSLSSVRLLSYRLGLNLSSSWASHSLSLNTDFSRSTDKIKGDWFYSVKGNIGYYWKGLGLNAMFQVNPYYISDLERLNQDKKFWTVAIRPNYTFNLTDMGIKGRVSLSADYINTYDTWMKYAETHLDYSLGNSWDLTGDLRLMDYSSSGSMAIGLNNTQFRIGLRKQFGRRTAIGNHKVQMSFYDDRNNNRIRDEAELLVENLVVKLDNHVSMTNEKGLVKYMNVPKGAYKLGIASDAEWRISAESELLVNKNLQVNVPLIKVVGVQGALTEIRNKYDRFESDVQGVHIYARSEAGLEIATLTDENGTFHFNLAPGMYTFFVKNNRYEFLKPSQELKVLSNQGKTDSLSFEFKKKNSDIRIQKF